MYSHNTLDCSDPIAYNNTRIYGQDQPKLTARYVPGAEQDVRDDQVRIENNGKAFTGDCIRCRSFEQGIRNRLEMLEDKHAQAS